MFFGSTCLLCTASAGPVCARCAQGLVAGGRVDVPGLASCRSVFVLDDACRTVIAAMKYRGQHGIARWLGQELAPAIPRLADVVTWVPATPERRRRRGFDQAELLARSAASSAGVPCVQLLRRASNDARQTGLSRAERQRGPAVEVVARCEPLVVLVDDVMTTGSSLRVAADALRQGGATRVVGIVVAATPAR